MSDVTVTRAELMGLFRSQDLTESVTAFMEKRNPVHQGR